MQQELRKLHDEKLQKFYAFLHSYYKDDPNSCFKFVSVYLLSQEQFRQVFQASVPLVSRLDHNHFPQSPLQSIFHQSSITRLSTFLSLTESKNHSQKKKKCLICSNEVTKDRKKAINAKVQTFRDQFESTGSLDNRQAYFFLSSCFHAT